MPPSFFLSSATSTWSCYRVLLISLLLLPPGPTVLCFWLLCFISVAASVRLGFYCTPLLLGYCLLLLISCEFASSALLCFCIWSVMSVYYLTCFCWSTLLFCQCICFCNLAAQLFCSFRLCFCFHFSKLNCDMEDGSGSGCASTSHWISSNINKKKIAWKYNILDNPANTIVVTYIG